MKSKKELKEVCMEIYRKLYKEAIPTADFDELVKLGKTKNKDLFFEYYLDEKKQLNLIKDIAVKSGLTDYETMYVTSLVLFGFAPNGHLEEKKQQDPSTEQPIPL